jgi:hypothetical protein
MMMILVIRGVAWFSKLFLILILLLAGLLRKLVFVGEGVAGRGSLCWFCILVIVVAVLIEPAAVAIEFEDVVGVFDGEGSLVGEVVEDFEPFGLVTGVHSFKL